MRRAKIKDKQQKKNNKSGSKKKHGKFSLSIRTQLIIGFLIPVLLVVGVGTFAYKKAEEGMLKNYGQSAQTALQMTVELLDYGFKSVDTDSIQIFNDSNVVNFASDTYKNDISLKSAVLSQAQQLIKSKQNSNEFIKDIIIVTADELNDIATLTAKGDNTGYYEQFMEISSSIVNAKDKADTWVGEHDFIDERFRTSTDSYIIAQYRMVGSQNACVIIDVSSEKIKGVIKDLNLGEGSIISFLTWDGRELSADSQIDFSFLGQEYYELAKAGEEDFYSDYVEVDGVEYLFMYGRCEINRSCICALTPKSVLVQETETIKRGIVFGVILSCVIVFGVGFMIVGGINRKMGTIIKRLSKVAEGDLTVDVQIRDRAEFGKLSGNIMNVVSNTKDLIVQVKDTSGQVSESVSHVKTAGDELASSNSYVQGITSEIAEGVNTQAEDTQNCLVKMDSLSEKIIEAGDSVREMKGLADDTKGMIEESTSGVNSLSNQAKETGKIMDLLAEKMSVLDSNMENIRMLVNTIDTISEETTLLSLNASIEAARAGEAGKGFAVVADEIKKLADHSKNSSEEITGVIDNLQVVFEETREASTKAGNIVRVQEDTVEEIRKMFARMSGNVEKLLQNISQSIAGMNEMDVYRKDTLENFESISAVSEETAASAQSVSATMSTQAEYVDGLLKATEELDSKMQELLSAIEMFTV
ncbi:MAG: methyl-accepting chemotaxis protein [Lachnospiraceae bacterium]